MHLNHGHFKWLLIQSDYYLLYLLLFSINIGCPSLLLFLSSLPFWCQPNTWFHFPFFLSISIVLLKKISVCPRIFNILQPIQVHFQIALYCFTGSTNTYKINIILIPLSNPLCHCRHPFQLCILHNHEVVFLLFLYNTVLNIFILNKTLLYATFSAKSIKKNKSFYFTITYSFPIALLLFGWVSDLTHFPSLWRISFNISSKACLLATNFINVYVRKSLSLIHF